MKTAVSTLFLATVLITASGQSPQQRDSLVQVICNTIIASEGKPDSARIMAAYEAHLFPFVTRYSEERFEEISMSIYYRLQRNCPPFKEILDRTSPSSDWEKVDSGTVSQLKRRHCRKFFKQEKFSYLEANGDTVHVDISNGYWTDRFRDGTFSRLSVTELGPCEFEITFIESDNESRRNFSAPGDTYRYTIIDNKGAYYEMVVTIPETNQHVRFRLYPR